MSKKFAIIGNGYWGDILNSKLSTLGDVVYFSNSRNFEQLSKDIDWVFVATPSLTHFEIARKLLIRGFNVFIEKPPCFSLKEYTQLVEVAKNSNCKFYVDNVFLFRSELKDKIGLLDSKFIKFSWKKFGPFKDSIIMDLLYHDLYILLSLYKVDSFEVEFVTHEENSFQLKALINNIPVSFEYDRTFNGYIKSIENQIGIIHLNKSDEDPLLILINELINGRESFNDNLDLNKRTVELFERILCLPEIKKEFIMKEFDTI